MQTLVPKCICLWAFLPARIRDFNSLPESITIQSTSDGPSGHLLDLIQTFTSTRCVSSLRILSHYSHPIVLLTC
jgi:hypothetical protein